MEKLHSKGIAGLGAAIGLLLPTAMVAQITITAPDMFNQPGQYYRAYANAGSSVSVNGMIGNAGAGQFWDFTSGPTDVTYRFDYLAASGTPHGADFVTAGAQMAEQKTDESDPLAAAWLYFTQSPAQGRLAYGFYDPGFSAGVGSSEPQVFFSPVMNDFPVTIQYGSAWNAATTFTNTITFGDPEDPEDPGFTMDLRYDYSSAAVVDAHGLANSPGTISFGDCLRVNELVRYDVSADLGDGFEHVSTDYVRNYYWLRQGRGIIAQITSKQESGVPPPDNFAIASSIVRMFQTNHPDNSGGSGGIQGFKITVGPTGALLQWTQLASLSSYRVEYTTNLVAGSWQQVGSTTTGSFLIDTAANKPATPMRFYRVVGTP